MQRRISPILIAAILCCGIPATRRETEEPAKDPQAPPKRDDLPASPGALRPVSETYERRYGLDLFEALEPPCAIASYSEPRPRPIKRTHAPRDRAAQRAAKKVKSAAKKRRGR